MRPMDMPGLLNPSIAKAWALLLPRTLRHINFLAKLTRFRFGVGELSAINGIAGGNNSLYVLNFQF